MIHDESRLSACPPDATLASFYACELARHEDDALRDHLVDCAACRERARDAAAFAEAMKDAARESRRGRRIGGVPVWAVAMAAVFAAAVILVLWRTAAPPSPVTSPDVASARPAPATAGAPARWREWAVDPAPYDPDEARGILWRGGEPTSAANDKGSLAWAMEPYVAGDFAGAAERLGRRLRAEPADEQARFYLGVSLLLAGQPAESVEPLRRVEERRGPLGADASWYLAVACLRTGDEARAAELLRNLSAQGGDRGERARELLREIEGKPAR